MSVERAKGVTRTIHVAAAAGVVYALIADAAKWPLYLSPCIHVERLEFDGERERIRVWALLDGRLQSWVSLRRLDLVERRVEFCHELPSSLVEVAGSSMNIRSEGPCDTLLELLVHFKLADLSSSADLAELKSAAERWTRLDELTLSFEQSVHIEGPAESAYDFLYRVGDWPGLVPFAARADVTEDAPGVQRVAMETVTEHGTYSTESVRICFPHAGRILCKGIGALPLLDAYTVEWSVVPDETGTIATVRHCVVLREEELFAVLGAGADLADGRRFLREVLSRNSLALLMLAKAHAESSVNTR
jgi:ribosome-associated toxin RatA of RatAB toxin-antitoxin module